MKKRIKPKSTKSDKILRKGGMSQKDIDAARLYNVANTMQRDMYIAQLLIVSGVEVMRELIPDVSTEQTAEWARLTLQKARLELQKNAR